MENYKLTLSVYLFKDIVLFYINLNEYWFEVLYFTEQSINKRPFIFLLLSDCNERGMSACTMVNNLLYHPRVKNAYN